MIVIPESRFCDIYMHGADNLVVYDGACDVGEGLDEFISAYQAGSLLGVAGLFIHERTVGSLPPEVRAHVGGVLGLCGAPFVADDQSLAWAAHLGLKARRGTWMEWLTIDPDDPTCGVDSAIACGVDAAIRYAFAGIPAWLYVRNDWGSYHNVRHSPLFRWAVDSGVEKNIIYGDADIVGSPVAVQKSIIDERVKMAKDMIAELIAGRERRLGIGGPVTEEPIKLVGLGGEDVSSPGIDKISIGPCVLYADGPYRSAPEPIKGCFPGGTFDPATHYTKDYYGGIGGGIPFVWPDGRADIYHSTSNEWGGFGYIAEFMAACASGSMFHMGGAMEKGKTLLDIGCSSGCFVKHAVNAGFNATGVDISEDAVAMADLETRQRLLVADIATKHDLFSGSDYDFITAWDLMEHIQESKLDDMIEGIRLALKVGGQGWFNICTRGNGERDYSFEPPCEITQENAWLLVAGHLTIRCWSWWVGKFAEHSLIPSWPAMQMFHVLRCEEPSMKNLDSWSARNLLVVDRVE